MLYTHLSWFIYLLSTLLFSIASMFFTLYSGSFSFSLSLFFMSSSPLTLSIYLDPISSSFISVILVISTIISVYALNYISPYSNSKYFMWLTVLFVVSILLVVLISNVFFIILGWDGLGLVSFFLIVFYQNQSSITSGLFTVLINRIGDCLFLITIPLIMFSSPSLGSWFTPFVVPSLITIFLTLTFITKSAIFPFSPWLPLAMAAPTPISALVHSSTLVTAGLYLIMRYSNLILINSQISSYLLLLSLFTSLYAGLNSVFERDLNNLIALSTLSHLGFIGISFSCGLIHLAFFHLLSHALFKSLLFMSIGDIIINLSHMQDIRFLSSGNTNVPSSSAIMQVSLINLIGLPSISGFFSNDLVLETFIFSNTSIFIVSIIYFNVILTFFYTIQLLIFNFQSNNITPYNNLHSFSSLHSYLLLFLSLFSVLFGAIFISHIFSSIQFLCLSLDINLLPFLILIIILLVTFSLNRQVQFFSISLTWYFSSISNLLYFCIPISSNFMFSLGVSTLNLCETGLFSHLLNSNFSSQLLFLSSRLVTLSSSSPLFLSLIIICLLISLFAI